MDCLITESFTSKTLAAIAAAMELKMLCLPCKANSWIVIVLLFSLIINSLLFKYPPSFCSFINDSKATNVNASWFALESMQKDVVWIAGGVDKGNDYSELYEMVTNKVKAIICLGENNQKIINSFQGKVDTIVQASSMHEAVNQSFSLANKGEAVLLSPACASFDLFENYEDRGFKFKKSVRTL